VDRQGLSAMSIAQTENTNKTGDSKYHYFYIIN